MSNYFDSLTPEERDEIRSRKPKTKTFYETVLDEIGEYKNFYGLCYSSRTFSKKFSDKTLFGARNYIVLHAKKFLNQLEKNEFEIGKLYAPFNSVYLFEPLFDSSLKRLFEIRLEFLKYCIENNLDIS